MNRIPKAIWCHEHDRWECYFIDGLEDPPEKRIPKCCHNKASEAEPWCEVHRP